MTRICVIGDSHYGLGKMNPARRGEFGDVLLLRAVHRINELIKPDLTILLGDMVNDGNAPDGEARMITLREIVDKLESPCITIPGNHDGDVEKFYKVFESPQDIIDIKGTRFLPFTDPERPGYNAERMAPEIERMSHAARNHSGPVVSLQHVPLFPPGASKCHYNYVNADEIIQAMKENGITHVIGAHNHGGIEPIRNDGISYLAVPALCESPFRFWEILIDEDEAEVTNHELRLPEELGLVDCHVHTPLAYCSENMEFKKAVDLADIFGLADMSFSEHSGQLYFDAREYWKGEAHAKGLEGRLPENDRMQEYLSRAKSLTEHIGFEVDADFKGRQMLRDEDREHASFLIGSVHKLPELRKPEPDEERVIDEFMFLSSKIVASGIQVLAHPFRIFHRANSTTPEHLFEPMVEILRENDVAAEINFHKYKPPARFVEMCVNGGVNLAFGSDAHNLYEVGEFAPHLELMKECGFDADLNEILIDPRKCSLLSR